MAWKKAYKILVIGLGKIGYSNAEYMTSIGLNVDGFDTNREAVQYALQNRVINNEAISLDGYDYYVVSVSTHRHNNISQPCLDGIFEIGRKLSSVGKQDALVSIESTVTQGTCRKLFDLLGQRLHVAHVPHRFYENEKKEHGVKQTRVLGACNGCCMRESLFFYKEILGIPLHIVASVEIAELSKIVENSYRFLEIAFAEELKMFCDAAGIDFVLLRNAINSKWNVKVLEAREGILGHCLPKDSEMYLDLAKEFFGTSILDLAKKVDYLYKLRIGSSLEHLKSLYRKKTLQAELT